MIQISMKRIEKVKLLGSLDLDPSRNNSRSVTVGLPVQNMIPIETMFISIDYLLTNITLYSYIQIFCTCH